MGGDASLVEGAINEICVKKRSRPRYFRHRIIGDEVSKYRGEGLRTVDWDERERGGKGSIHYIYMQAIKRPRRPLSKLCQLHACQLVRPWLIR